MNELLEKRREKAHEKMMEATFELANYLVEQDDEDLSEVELDFLEAVSEFFSLFDDEEGEDE